MSVWKVFFRAPLGIALDGVVETNEVGNRQGTGVIAKNDDPNEAQP